MEGTCKKVRVGASLFVVLLALLCAGFAVNAAATVPQAFGSEVPTDKDEEYYSFGVGSAIEKATVEFTSAKSQVYTGKVFAPAFVVKLNGKTLVGTTDPSSTTADFYYFYMNNVDPGTGDVSKGTGPYVSIVTFEDGIPFIKNVAFTITKAPIKSAKVKLPAQVYTGKKLKPAANVTYQGMTLKQGKDYTIKYSNNVKAGKGKVTITGKGSYTGTKTATFTIKKASIANAKFSKIKAKTYTGKAFTPSVTIKYKGKKLKKGKGYTLKYKKNTNAGIAKIVVAGKGNMRGTHTLEFTINPRPLSQTKVTVDNGTWTGGLITPAVKVTYGGKTLKTNSDYTVRYTNNSDAGTKAKAIFYAWGNFTGSVEKTFTIYARSIVGAYNWDSKTNKAGSNSAGVKIHWYNTIAGTDIQKPTVAWGVNPRPTVSYIGRTLVWGRDYKLTWAPPTDSTKGGTGKVTITTADPGLSGNLTGTVTLEYTVLKAS